MEKRNKTQPHEVTNAVILLYLILILGFIYFISNISTSSDLVQQVASLGYGLGFIIFVSLFNLAFLFFFIYKINKGKNWARITLLILFITGIPFSIFNLFTLTNLIYVITSVGSMILYIIVFVLLFQKPSSDWFRAMKRK